MSNPWPLWEGEIRSCQRTPVLPGTISARMWVKQRNQSNEDLLLRYAEPLNVWVSLLKERLGSAWHEAALPPFPLSRMAEETASMRGLLDRAWRALLENQHHDGICGCSVDEVHREMMTRFDACQQIGEGLVDIGFSELTTQVDTGGESAIVVFNPLDGPRTDFVFSRWLLPDDSTGTIEAVDPSGKRLPCQILNRPKPDVMKMPGVPSQWMEIGFLAPSVPGYGYKTFRIVAGHQAGPAEPVLANEIENEPQRGAHCQGGGEGRVGVPRPPPERDRQPAFSCEDAGLPLTRDMDLVRLVTERSASRRLRSNRQA